MQQGRLEKAGSLGAFSQARSKRHRRQGLLAIKQGTIPVRNLNSDEGEGANDDEIRVSKSKRSRAQDETPEEQESQSQSKSNSPGTSQPEAMTELAKAVKELSSRMERLEKSGPSGSPLGRIGEVIKKRGAIQDSNDDSSSDSSSSSEAGTDKVRKSGKRTFTAPAIKKRKVNTDTVEPQGLMVGFEGLTSSIANENKISLSNIQHRVRMFGNISRSVTEGNWDDPQGRENKRNKYEALSLARGLDLDISALGQEGAARLPSAEVRIRRMIALERATEDGSWEVAKMLEENFQGYDADTNRALKEAIRLKKSMERTPERGGSVMRGRVMKRPVKKEAKES